MKAYVLEETQTHFYFKESQEEAAEIYEQCLTCRSVTFSYTEAINGEYPMGCIRGKVPVLPACKYKEDTGLTLRKIEREEK